MNNGVLWSEDRVEILKTLWDKGLSCSQIANEIGNVTRNAVIGKASRLGLSGRHGRLNQYSAVRARVRAKRLPQTKQTRFSGALLFEPAPAPEPFVSRVISMPPLNLTLLDLAHGQCRYPVTDDAPFLFCGHAQQKDSSYCPAHQQITWTAPAYRKATKKRVFA
jgi:GcrA cell cycle regulator